MNAGSAQDPVLSGRGHRLAGLLVLAVCSVLLLEGVARLADRVWRFSTPVRWVVNTLVPEEVVSGDETSLFERDNFLAMRIPAVKRSDAEPYILGGVIISGVVHDAEWAWIDKDVGHEGVQVAVLGGSAAFGYPYSYEAGFASLLHERFRDSGIRVANLARPGMSSQDIRIIMDRVYDWIEPDALVIMMGNNEFVRWNPFWKSHLDGTIWSVLSRMSSSRLVSAALYFKFKRMQAGQKAGINDDEFHQHAQLTGYQYASDHMMEKGHAWDHGHWQKTREAYLNRFEKNLSLIIQDAKERGIDVYLLTVPVRYKLSPAWKHPQPLGGEAGNLQSFENRMTNFNGAFQKGNYEAANAVADHMIERWPESPIPFYVKGVVAESMGDNARAIQYYAQSRDLMVGNLGSMVAVNDIIRDVAVNEGAVLVDIERVFSEDSLREGVIDLYMDDDCHPNAAGHRRIAGIVEELIAENY